MSDPHARLQDLAGPVSRETYEKLRAFETTFRKWARSINLAAPSTLDDLWERHVLDSAQLLPLAPHGLTWLDLGSGGGFPGAVLAIMLRERPGASVTLVESNGKKAAFLQTALAGLDVSASVLRVRIEDAVERTPAVEIVTARALAPLPHLLELSGPWLTAGARGLFHKGRDYRREVQESRVDWDFDLVEHADRIDPDGIVLEVAALRR